MPLSPNPASKRPTIILIGTSLLHSSPPPPHQRKVSIIPLCFLALISALYFYLHLYFHIHSVDDKRRKPTPLEQKWLVHLKLRIPNPRSIRWCDQYLYCSWFFLCPVAYWMRNSFEMRAEKIESLKRVKISMIRIYRVCARSRNQGCELVWL